MGTIADLLSGVELSAFTDYSDTTGQEHDSATEENIPSQDTCSTQETIPLNEAPLNSQSEAGTLLAAMTIGERFETDPPSAEEIAMSALLEESQYNPEALRAQMTLRGDLDLDDLQIYAIVAAVERTLKRSFTDEEIRGWNTIGDYLAAVTISNH